MKYDLLKWTNVKNKGKRGDYKIVASHRNVEINEREDSGKIIDIVFEEQVIGLTVNDIKGSIEVTAVREDSEAKRKGVVSGDIVIHVNNSKIYSPQAFSRKLASVGRPVTISFQKRRKFNLVESARMSMSSLMKSVDESRPPMTEEDRAQQREAMARAAEARNMQWDKRLERNRQSQNNRGNIISEENVNSGPKNPFTEKAVKHCLNAERATTESLGYNPYEAKIVNHNEAIMSISNQSRTDEKSGDDSESIIYQEISEEEQLRYFEIMDEIDEALSQIISSGNDDSTTKCIETLDKVLINIAEKSDEKFRKIRLSNAAFSTKVIAVPGGMDFLLSAGFKLESDNDEAYLLYLEPFNPQPLRLRIALQRLADVKLCAAD